jgi:putative transcriptional regulator
MKKKKDNRIVRFTAAEVRRMSREHPFDKKLFGAITDEDIARQIAEDPDVAPDITTLPDEWRVKPRSLRRKLGMTQRQMAKLLRIGLGTLRNWEQGRTLPDGPAKSLLIIAEREPKAVLRALRD